MDQVGSRVIKSDLGINHVLAKIQTYVQNFCDCVRGLVMQR